MVGWLIQKKDIRFLKKQSGQCTFVRSPPENVLKGRFLSSFLKPSPVNRQSYSRSYSNRSLSKSPSAGQRLIRYSSRCAPHGAAPAVPASRSSVFWNSRFPIPAVCHPAPVPALLQSGAEGWFFRLRSVLRPQFSGLPVSQNQYGKARFLRPEKRSVCDLVFHMYSPH